MACGEVSLAVAAVSSQMGESSGKRKVGAANKICRGVVRGGGGGGGGARVTLGAEHGRRWGVCGGLSGRRGMF